MKKKITLALVAILMTLTSCKKEDVTESNNSYYVSAELTESITNPITIDSIYISAQDSISGYESYTPEFIWGRPFDFKLSFSSPINIKRVPFKLSVYLLNDGVIQPVLYLITVKKNGVIVWSQYYLYDSITNNYQLYTNS